MFVDSRADVYGDPFLLRYRETFEVRPPGETAGRYNVDYVLMEPGCR
ncbi:MAG: hypothetical protein H6656_07090 [Ardenticatenaceae bacterium]|nr:hypothetical protein [Ardenticatenaceae bacterium]